jgi:hypothetical protein
MHLAKGEKLSHAERFRRGLLAMRPDPVVRDELSTPEGRSGWYEDVSRRPVHNTWASEHRAWMQAHREECLGIMEQLFGGEEAYG